MSAGGGLKFDQDKAPLELLDRVFLFGVAMVLAFGAKKYARDNWRKGIELSRLIGAAMRHILAFNDGEDNDEESGLSHLYHAGCCLMFAARMHRDRPDLDDRYKRPTPPADPTFSGVITYSETQKPDYLMMQPITSDPLAMAAGTTDQVAQSIAWCPFHDTSKDANPSLHLSHNTRTFRCSDCNVHGYVSDAEYDSATRKARSFFLLYGNDRTEGEHANT